MEFSDIIIIYKDCIIGIVSQKQASHCKYKNEFHWKFILIFQVNLSGISSPWWQCYIGALCSGQMEVDMKKLEDYVRSIPDFPEPGIVFRDVTSVLQDKEGLRQAIDKMQELLEGVEFDVIVGPESRGFIFGVPLAYNLYKPFIPIRKKGKLPCATISMEYELEYGKATIEMHRDAIIPGQKVVIVDDLIATGGTIEAITKLVEMLGGEVVKIIFLMELKGLNGRDKLEGYDVEAVIQYEGK